MKTVSIALLGVFVFFSISSTAAFARENVVDADTRTVVRVFKSAELGEHPVLLVALHGDTAPWDRSGAQYVFAERLAARTRNVVAVGLLRPGYVDPDNRRSDGDQGEGVGDNYDETRVDQIAKAIVRLRERFNAAHVVLVGQSGGAATTANLIAMRPGLVDHAVLLACPCDIAAWRQHMYRLTEKAVFEADIGAVSPIDIVPDIAPTTIVTVIVGRDDTVAPPDISRRYHEALRKAGKQGELLLIEGDHEIFLTPRALEEVGRIVLGYAIR